MKFISAISFAAAVVYLVLFIRLGAADSLYAGALLLCTATLSFVFDRPVPSPYWFRNHRFGYGSTPSTWQGWLILAGVCTLLGSVSLLAESSTESLIMEAITLYPFLAVIIATFLIIVIRTGERWKLQFKLK